MNKLFSFRWGIPITLLLAASLMSWFSTVQLNSISHENELSYEFLLSSALMDKTVASLEAVISLSDAKGPQEKVQKIIQSLGEEGIVHDALLLAKDLQPVYRISKQLKAGEDIIAHDLEYEAILKDIQRLLKGHPQFQPILLYEPDLNKLLMLHPVHSGLPSPQNFLLIYFDSATLKEITEAHRFSLGLQSGLVAFSLAFIFSILIYVVLVRRLERLRFSVEQIRKGKKNVEFFNSGNDEIGQLASTIEYMHIERSKFEEQLEDSKDQLNKAQFITHIGSWDWNIEENTLSWTDEIYRIFGLKPQEFEANYEAFLERVHPDDREIVNAAVSVSLEKNVEYKVEHRVVQLSGEVRNVLEQGFITRNEEGTPTRMLGTVLDITDRKQIEDELQQSKDKLEIRVEERTAEAYKLLRAVEGSPNVVLITNADGDLEYANHRFEEVFGYDVSSVLGKKPSILRDDNLTSKEVEVLWSTISSGKVWRGEFHNRTKAGGRVWQAASIAPVKNKQGEITNYIATQENIDQLKLIEEQLLEAIQQAEEASRTKGLFLANMSHEIRTPMNSIIGMTDLVLETGLTKYQKKHLTSVSLSSKALLFLLNEILDLSKLDAGKLTLESTIFDLREVIELVLDTLYFESDRKGLQLKSNVSPELPYCFRGDPGRLRQVLVNIAGNAVKFTRDGSVTIEVHPTEEEGLIHIQVIDTGIGIAKESIGKIFESFSQADDSTTRKFGGTGLGTTISKRIIEVMGGAIYVESTLGKGSIFHIKVPLKVVTDCTECRANTLQEKKQNLQVAPLKILIVEDQVLNQELVVNRLEQQQHTTVIAEDGQIALDALEAEDFDLILMDIHMPNMDGLTATRHIREKEKKSGKHVKIIALTASAMAEEKQECWDAGVDAFVTKPIDFPTLFFEMAKLFPEQVIAQEEATTAPESFVTLGGFDTKRGLTIWGSAKVYKKAILGFIAEYQNADLRLSQLLEQHDNSAVTQMAHSLKGVAGNLAATKLFEVAGLIEELSRSGEQIAPEILEKFQNQLKIVTQAEAVLLKEKERRAALSEFDPAKVAKLLSDIRESLLHGAIDEASYDELEKYLQEAQVQPIQKWVDEFEFDKAVAAIDDLAKQLNLEIGS